MDPNTFPTKGNLILAKNSLALAKPVSYTHLTLPTIA